MAVTMRLIVVSMIAPLFVGLVPPTAFGQRQGGMGQRMPRYDTKTESTLKGVVEEVKTVTGMMGAGGRMAGRGMGMQGTHLTLKTDNETIEVHLGPSAFLKETGVEIAKGEAVEVVGSRVKIGERDALIAREVRKGEAAWTLRDANGLPLWMRMGR